MLKNILPLSLLSFGSVCSSLSSTRSDSFYLERWADKASFSNHSFSNESMQRNFIPKRNKFRTPEPILSEARNAVDRTEVEAKDLFFKPSPTTLATTAPRSGRPNPTEDLFFKLSPTTLAASPRHSARPTKDPNLFKAGPVEASLRQLPTDLQASGSAKSIVNVPPSQRQQSSYPVASSNESFRDPRCEWN